MSEAELQANVIQLATLLGWHVYHTFDSRRSHPGFPDLVLVHPNRDWPVLAIELKSLRGRLSTAQQWWLDALNGRSITARLWTPEQWRTGVIEERLRDPYRSTTTTLVAMLREALIAGDDIAIPQGGVAFHQRCRGQLDAAARTESFVSAWFDVRDRLARWLAENDGDDQEAD